jgi:hypothetical protein
MIDGGGNNNDNNIIVTPKIAIYGIKLSPIPALSLGLGTRLPPSQTY